MTPSASLWLRGEMSPGGPDHELSCQDPHPGPTATDAPCRAPTGPITHCSALLLINYSPAAPDVGEAGQAGELPSAAEALAGPARCARQRAGSDAARSAQTPDAKRHRRLEAESEPRPRAGRNFPGIKRTKRLERLPREAAGITLAGGFL